MSGAPIRAIRRNVGSYLNAIEAEGRQSFSVQDVFKSPGVRRIVEDLHIEFGTRIPTKGDIGSVNLWYPGGASDVNAEHVVRAVEVEMGKADNRRKLGKALALAERHLFVVIDVDHYAPWVALNDCVPPENVPDFADEVTHMWVATITRDPGEWIVWSAARGCRWQRTWLRSL